MIGLKNKDLILIPHNKEWITAFELEKKLLNSVLKEKVLDIQHIGSTSIQGIYAKPIIDISIAVNSFQKAKETIPLIEKLGYTYRGENGIINRHYFIKQKNDIRTHHIHMVEVKSKDWVQNIRFRDILIKHPEVAKKYEKLKLELMNKFRGDRAKYTDAKSSFISDVLSNDSFK